MPLTPLLVFRRVVILGQLLVGASASAASSAAGAAGAAATETKGGSAGAGGVTVISAEVQAHALRALRFVFGVERNRKVFQRLFPPEMFAGFIDVGNYVHDLVPYRRLVKMLNDMPVRRLLLLLSPSYMLECPCRFLPSLAISSGICSRQRGDGVRRAAHGGQGPARGARLRAAGGARQGRIRHRVPGKRRRLACSLTSGPVTAHSWTGCWLAGAKGERRQDVRDEGAAAEGGNAGRHRAEALGRGHVRRSRHHQQGEPFVFFAITLFLLTCLSCGASQLEHPNIIKYYTSFVEGSNLYIVMELVEGGQLAVLVWLRFSASPCCFPCSVAA